VINSGSIAVSDNPYNRATSHAKTVRVNEQETALDRARALKERFDHAKAAQQPLSEPEKPRQLESPARSTSYAKSLDNGEQKNALDRARALREQFARTNARPEAAREQQNLPPGQKAAQAAHAPRPEQHLRAEGEIRRTVDRAIDREKLAKEDQRARQANEEFKARLRQAQINRGKDMDREI